MFPHSRGQDISRGLWVVDIIPFQQQPCLVDFRIDSTFETYIGEPCQLTPHPRRHAGSEMTQNSLWFPPHKLQLTWASGWEVSLNADLQNSCQTRAACSLSMPRKDPIPGCLFHLSPSDSSCPNIKGLFPLWGQQKLIYAFSGVSHLSVYDCPLDLFWERGNYRI